MINNPIIFYLALIMTVVFVFLSLIAKNVIRSLLSAIMVFFLAALFFYIMGSEYNAIIQAAVYGLAVPVIIGVSIMFMSFKSNNVNFSTLSYLVCLFAGMFIMMFLAITMIPDSFDIVGIPQTNAFDVISSFAKGIFINYVWAFELISLLLTIVIAGLAMFRRKSS